MQRGEGCVCVCETLPKLRFQPLFPIFFQSSTQTTIFLYPPPHPLFKKTRRASV